MSPETFVGRLSKSPTGNPMHSSMATVPIVQNQVWPNADQKAEQQNGRADLQHDNDRLTCDIEDLGRIHGERCD